eukprot:gene7589-9036_t
MVRGHSITVRLRWCGGDGAAALVRRTWARNAKQAAELEALTEDLAAELLCIYPPSDDPSRSDAFRQFCFPEPYKLELHHGFLPPLPKDDHFVFCMTEGMAAPVPLYGACIRTQEPGAKQQVHVIAPRCYCLFSRSPMFEALFCVLHSLMLQVLVPEGFDERAGNKVQVAHGTSAQSCIFEEGPVCIESFADLREAQQEFVPPVGELLNVQFGATSIYAAVRESNQIETAK